MASSAREFVYGDQRPHVEVGEICIMVTGKREQHDRLLGFEVGADDYVEKPFTLEYLGRVISKLAR